MMRHLVLVIGLASPVCAEAPRVVTDIAPVHSLVSQVMSGVAEPDLLLLPGQSPHTYALKPSDGRKLQRADVVFWIGEGLTPWLAKPLDSLAADAHRIELLDVDGLPLLKSEEEHDEHEEDHADHDEHDAHDEDHADHDEHDEHDEDHAEHDAHDEHEGHHHHGEFDPHAWLDPSIAQVWLSVIAEELSEADPDNASVYKANAEAAQAELSALDAELSEMLHAIEDKPYVAFHDAYRYFETRYDLTNAGTVSPSDARDPGAARVAELRAEIKEHNVRCGFAEPQYDPALLSVAGEGVAFEIAELDPLGADIAIGPDQYSTLLRAIAQSLTGCLVE